MCKLYSKHKQLKTMICRFYNVYGPHQVESGKWSTVIGIFEKQFRDNKPLTIKFDSAITTDAFTGKKVVTTYYVYDNS